MCLEAKGIDFWQPSFLWYIDPAEHENAGCQARFLTGSPQFKMAAEMTSGLSLSDIFGSKRPRKVIKESKWGFS